MINLSIEEKEIKQIVCESEMVWTRLDEVRHQLLHFNTINSMWVLCCKNLELLENLLKELNDPS